MAVADRKPYWNLGEAVEWIRTRDIDRVADMWGLSELDAVTRFLAAGRQLLSLAVVPLAIARRGSPKVFAAEQERRLTAISDDPPFDVDLSELIREVQSGRLRMTMIRAPAADLTRVAIDSTEALDLDIRVTFSEYPVALWSRSRRIAAGHSPWFSSADVSRIWPSRGRKTSAATKAILCHLRKISTEEHPLTKAVALDRCLAEVPGAYPEAFRRAWRSLEPTQKRHRGQHGPRVH
jgi:hypothetical protein